MSEKFILAGYTVTEKLDNADIFIINTCSVTNMSERKSRQMIRKAREKNKNAIVVVTGCYAQVAKEEISNMPEVDIVLGNSNKKDIIEYIEKYIEESNILLQDKHEIKMQNLEAKTKQTNKMLEVEDAFSVKKFEDFGTVTYTEKTRAVVKIQDGCDRFCSYCIIPYARGRVRSRTPDSIIKEIEEIAQKGIKEVVITGIHIASYGKDFKQNYTLIDLLEEMNKVEGIERIRLGSLEPTLITEEFIKRLVKLNKICHHFHLSLQSGCNETLKRMNRRYTTEQFQEIVERIRKNYADVVLTTDIIVGFPGETNEEFNNTYEFLKQIKFYKMHVFPYSIRKGTKAAEMPEQIDGTEKERRSKLLIQLSNENELSYNKEYIGKTVDVLIEENAKGHTANYILVKVKQNKENQPKLEENKIAKIFIIGAEAEYLIGIEK